MHLPHYLGALWKDWVSRMSGLASIALAVGAVVFPSIPAKVALSLAAAVCFLLANYMVWRGTQPVLSVEIMEVYLGSGLLPHESLSDAYLTIVFRMCAKTTTLAVKDIECYWKDGSASRAGVAVPCRTDEQWVASQSHPGGGIDLLMFMSSAMSQGWLKTGWLRFQFPSVAPMDITGGRLKIVVRDSYDVKHVVRRDVPAIRSERDYGAFLSSTAKPTAPSRNPHINAEWLALADRFKEVSRHMGVQLHTASRNGNEVDTWSFRGEAEESRKCQALCARAGILLTKSPLVASRLSQRVLSNKDHAERWLCFLRDSGAVRLDPAPEGKNMTVRLPFTSWGT